MENLLSGKRFSFTEKNLHEIEIRPATDIAFISLRDYYKDLNEIMAETKTSRLVVTRYAKFLGVTPPRKYRTLEDIFAELN